MIEIEAKHLAEAIRKAALPELRVEGIESHSEREYYQVRCSYSGPTFKRDQQLFLHGMHIYIASPYEWSQLHKLLKSRFHRTGS